MAYRHAVQTDPADLAQPHHPPSRVSGPGQVGCRVTSPCGGIQDGTAAALARPACTPEPVLRKPEFGGDLLT